MEVRVEQGLLLQQTWPLLLGPPDAPSGQQRLSTQARLRAVTQSHIPSGNSRATASLVSTHKGKRKLCLLLHFVLHFPG